MNLGGQSQNFPFSFFHSSEDNPPAACDRLPVSRGRSGGPCPLTGSPGSPPGPCRWRSTLTLPAHMFKLQVQVQVLTPNLTLNMTSRVG